ncbi:hypothetical protein EDC96DRAFT_267584 [Choanephora cucurbitarum]|nr:hypothetical protein EDC96DRAFT_267584 [Choanephora cucurbitarum]
MAHSSVPYPMHQNRLSFHQLTSPHAMITEPIDPPIESLHDHPQEITWLFFRDNKWIPFQSNNHYKIEQAFTLGGIYVDIKDLNFPHLKSIRVFPTRMYLSYLGMKYRLSCVIQG